MKNIFQPKTQLEHFGFFIYFLLVENFPQTFFVGGMVRDILLGCKVTDIDISTSATPEEVMNLLLKNKIRLSTLGKSFGVVKAHNGKQEIEIATFRKESYGTTRYPKINLIKNPKIDSQRRDFTINSLYLKAKNGEVLDYNKGLGDIKLKLIRFIGKPKIRIKEDPLRIIRALRFCLVLNFKLEKNTAKAIKNNFNLVQSLSKSKLNFEILKIKNKRQRKILQTVIDKPKMLDKYFKVS